jgi:hypothetical protein
VGLEAQLSLEADVAAVVVALDGYDGTVLRDEHAEGLYWLVLKPSSDPRERFYARVEWADYTTLPASVRFCDGIRGPSEVNRAWPNIPGYRLGAFDICQPFTAEGFAVHPEWTNGPEAWRPTGNPFLYLANRLQFDLNNRYQGRHA